MSDWQIGLIVVAGVMGLVGTGLYFLAKSLSLKYEDRAKRKIPITDILTEYDIPDPPTQYCEKCGEALQWRLLGAMEHYEGKFNQTTGKPQFIVFARFSCPTSKKHDPLWDGVYWLNTGADGWAWYEPFQVRTMREAPRDDNRVIR